MEKDEEASEADMSDRESKSSENGNIGNFRPWIFRPVAENAPTRAR